MAKITISGTEEKKPVVTTPSTSGGTSSGTSGGNTGTTNTGAGTSSTAKPSGSTGTSGSWLSLLMGGAGNGSGYPFGGMHTTTTPQQDVKTNEERAETALADLKDKYSKNLQEQYDYSAQKLKNERDEALRENWILQQQAEAALPEQMAASGLNGGASETSLAALKARYQGDRNNIRGDYMNNLGDLSQQAQSDRAEAERSYNEQWLLLQNRQTRQDMANKGEFLCRL